MAEKLMGQLYHWNNNNKSSERLIVNTRLMNVFEQRFLIITFISEMIQTHRFEMNKNTFIDNKKLQQLRNV